MPCLDDAANGIQRFIVGAYRLISKYIGRDSLQTSDGLIGSCFEQT